MAYFKCTAADGARMELTRRSRPGLLMLGNQSGETSARDVVRMYDLKTDRSPSGRRRYSLTEGANPVCWSLSDAPEKPLRSGGNDGRTDIGRRAKGQKGRMGSAWPGLSPYVNEHTAKVFGRNVRLIESAFLPLHAIRRTGKFETTTMALP